ncbi:MAG: hypothetical protein IPK32_16775 [Verrucomicrobiaceae bacterium]|nr:hypothetical protein [Verrucomicrobiaceae bacterium]
MKAEAEKLAKKQAEAAQAAKQQAAEAVPNGEAEGRGKKPRKRPLLKRPMRKLAKQAKLAALLAGHRPRRRRHPYRQAAAFSGGRAAARGTGQTQTATKPSPWGGTALKPAAQAQRDSTRYSQAAQRRCL